jgi:hypothetical protein
LVRRPITLQQEEIQITIIVVITPLPVPGRVNEGADGVRDAHKLIATKIAIK